jgi:hypothetical protein
MTTVHIEDEDLLMEDDDLEAAAAGTATSLLALLYQQPNTWSAVMLTSAELPISGHSTL